AWNVFRQGNKTLSDKARIPEDEIRKIADGIEGIRSCHKIRTRGTPTEVYLDLHILVDPDMTVLDAHKLGNDVVKKLCDNFPEIADTTVHIEPDIPEERHNDPITGTKEESGRN
ncbi:MAG: cation diffusion facilitator family transporter, partial [Coriobacteriales bacterium]